MFLLDILICVVVVVLGFSFKSGHKGLSAKDRRILKALFLYHLLVGIGFYFYILVYGGDATHYWDAPKTLHLNEILEMIAKHSPSGYIFLFNYLPSKVLGLSFFSGNMLYILLGYYGFVYFYLIFRTLVTDVDTLKKFRLFNIKLFPFLFFLPNLHFWSSGIGKDTILFFTTALFIYSLLNLKTRIPGLVLSILISIFIRPHITLFLFVAFGIGYTFDSKLKAYKKAFLVVIFAAAFLSTFRYVMDFVQLESFDTETIEEYSSNKASSLNKEGSGSGIDISGYPYPLKVFTFLYQPLFFRINNPFAILASFENLVLLIVSIRFFRNRPAKVLRKASYIVKGMFVFFLLGTLSFSLILGNLGIMLRQKNVFVMVLLIVIFWSFSERQPTRKKVFKSRSLVMSGS